MRKVTATAVLLMVYLTPTLALARRVFVEDGTAGRDLQGGGGGAAFLALFPVVAVAVFAMARWAGWRG